METRAKSLDARRRVFYGMCCAGYGTILDMMFIGGVPSRWLSIDQWLTIAACIVQRGSRQPERMRL